MRHLFALNPYIWKYRTQLILGIIFVTLSNLFAVYPAQIIRTAINMVGDLLKFYQQLEGSSLTEQLQGILTKSLLLFGGLVLLMALIRGFFLFLTRQTLIVLSRLAEFDIRKDLYDQFQQLSLTYYRRNRTGDLMARISEDVTRVRMYLGPGIMYSLNTITLFFVVIFTMISVNPELTLYACLPLPLLSFLIYYVTSIIQKRSEKIQEQLSWLTTMAQEVFSGIRVIKAYVKEKFSYKSFAKESDEYMDRSLHLAKVDATFFPLVVFLVGLSILLVVWIGGDKVIRGELTVGNIAEFIIYINLITWPIIALGWVTTLIQRAAASQKRLNELFMERSELVFPRKSESIKQADISFRRISYTYPDTGIKAMDDVSFDIKPGQMLGVVGPTGSGKSTLCNLIPRLIDPEQGEIFIDDIPLRMLSKDELRSNIGYAPQDVFLFSDSIKENIAFGITDPTDEKVELAAKQASVHESIIEFPEGYDTVVGERGVTLSGGQKQRISIARALIREPLILVLDDVLSAVDTKTEEAILEYLQEYRRKHPKVAIIMVAHRMSCIQDADQIIVLENGSITEKGSHEELLKKDNYYARIFQKQQMEDKISS
ncbi:MAG: ABC transporter ATP-binding protein/permease [Bacteroidia bacterium]|nr:ABC transporter ATP-binding protein/permease [Bacteroidia bacterium]